MRLIVLGTLACLAVLQPADARSFRHHRAHRISSSRDVGMPITAQGGSIQINSVGEVISKPTPVIQKERSFNDRAQKDLSGKPDPMSEPNPPAKP